MEAKRLDRQKRNWKNMTGNAGKRKCFVIKFNRKGMAEKDRICRHFGWDGHLTVNGECLVSVPERHVGTFEETARRGFFSILERR